MKRLWLLLLFALIAVPPAHAHLGSKDVFEQVSAGPYKLFITIRPPVVIPGVATVEVRATGAPITTLSITPTPLTGEAASHPPTADILKRSDTDPNFYTGGVWLMASGSWQVRFAIDGPSGHQATSIPVPAVALSTLKMERSLGIPLALLGVFLVVSMAGVVAAAIRESRLAPGATPTPSLRRRGLIALAASLAVMVFLVYEGAKWWNVEAADYSEDIYHPLVTQAKLSGDQLDLTVKPFRTSYSADYSGNDRSNSDFLPDHNHLMHLYAIRQPQMDAVFHLHPELVSSGDFRMSLPVMPPGTYKLYGDVVHANGFPETLVSTIDVPAGLAATPAGPDDASATPAPISSGPLGASYKLPDGCIMVWDKPANLTASTAYSLHFRLLAPDGTPAKDMQPYMGMTGHAAFVKDDGTVFAHTHPEGSAAMAALDIANGSMGAMEGMSTGPTPPAVDFPYGFPTPGAYRVIIQMKHGITIETGVFDATVQ
ncbi:hypothetical protein HDF16_003215 [Granulicella aggregans]|uniref:Secreted protein n=1 Tax=Granulicella aggregans TaxID=474949 RepID=A0A7W8E4H1_9BACT|nr:hypothetical protein [Granulicella aggregans]MBB5058501.1 hypothetical protein [Granulicella aggregans]